MNQPEQTKDVHDVAEVFNADGKSRVVLVCEHASNFIPAQYSNLGLDDDKLESHIAWDPGALETAKAMSRLLDATLVHSNISRLVYDCNRPPNAESAIPQSSEVHNIPSNNGISQEQRDFRISNYYLPFEKLLSDTLDSRNEKTVIVTMHSFTPVYKGEHRDVEIGLLHDNDSALANALFEAADQYTVRLNEPYGQEDGVTHTLQLHALPRGLLNVMVEVRNDLITTPHECEQMAEKLVAWLQAALAKLENSKTAKLNHQ